MNARHAAEMLSEGINVLYAMATLTEDARRPDVATLRRWRAGVRGLRRALDGVRSPRAVTDLKVTGSHMAAVRKLGSAVRSRRFNGHERMVLIQQARRLLVRLGVVVPSDLETHLARARSYLDLNLVDDAKRALAAAKHMAPESLDVAALEREVSRRPPNDEQQEFYDLKARIEGAFQAGDLVAVERLAIRFLELAPKFPANWNYGNAIHFAHLALGRLALMRGDLDAAVASLLRAGDTPGSPQLNSFGPNMRLARDLLRAGKVDEVIEYLARCAVFWEMGQEQLDAWTEAIRRGEVPDFKGNLEY
jgi:tetratricopeptide (TPR) repeat protein